MSNISNDIANISKISDVLKVMQISPYRIFVSSLAKDRENLLEDQLVVLNFANLLQDPEDALKEFSVPRFIFDDLRLGFYDEDSLSFKEFLKCFEFSNANEQEEAALLPPVGTIEYDRFCFNATVFSEMQYLRDYSLREISPNLIMQESLNLPMVKDRLSDIVEDALLDSPEEVIAFLESSRIEQVFPPSLLPSSSLEKVAVPPDHAVIFATSLMSNAHEDHVISNGKSKVTVSPRKSFEDRLHKKVLLERNLGSWTLGINIFKEKDVRFGSVELSGGSFIVVPFTEREQEKVLPTFLSFMKLEKQRHVHLTDLGVSGISDLWRASLALVTD